MNRFVFQTEPMLFLHFMQRYIFFLFVGQSDNVIYRRDFIGIETYLNFLREL